MSMNTNKWFIVLSLVAVSGCITSAPKPYSSFLEPQKQVGVGIFEKNGAAIGVDFTPSETEGWSKYQSMSNVSLKKKGASNDEGWEIEAYLITLATPVVQISAYADKIVKNIREGYGQGERYKIASLDTAEYPDKGLCVKVHLLVEDTKPVRTVDHQGKKWSEQYILSCGLVKNRRIGVEVRYVNVFYDSNKDDLLSEKAARIFDSVEITDK
ncbi:hypothetical protein AGMMS50225_28120 [Betaproteobacteria bacterium]|nr:hypothetical protein AGMMS50225_28120 [Betaproteobacteria bacterium]